MQFETLVGTNGIKLSGGQTQCVAIARALVKNPACLILDEATSALDAVTQKEVAKNVYAMQARDGFTVVQIAHRLETLVDSDVLYFMVLGKVVETGGERTLNRSACSELLKKRVVLETFTDPETGKVSERVKDGHFKDLWDTAHDIVGYHKMAVKDLKEKMSTMSDELEKAKAAHAEKQDSHNARMGKFRASARSIGRGAHAAREKRDSAPQETERADPMDHTHMVH